MKWSSYTVWSSPADWHVACTPDAVARFTTLEVENQFVLRTLAAEHNNKTRAADRLAISTKTRHNMLQRWGLLGRTAVQRSGL